MTAGRDGWFAGLPLGSGAHGGRDFYGRPAESAARKDFFGTNTLIWPPSFAPQRYIASFMNESAGGVFTGERLIAGDPLFQADFARHLVAYRFAQDFARDRRVLDAGCGDGYGTDLLAGVAAYAIGTDRSAEAIAVATRRYKRCNLEYRACELNELSKLGERFELVCNFQVIEHLPDPLPFLEQVREVIEPGGVLIVTTPNRLNSLVENPYHVHEYVADELLGVLRRVFSNVEIRGICGDEKAMAYDRERAAQANRILRMDPLNLRRLVPRRAIELAYPILARLVRRRVAASRNAGIELSLENFTLSSDCDASLDLLAVCRSS